MKTTLRCYNRVLFLAIVGMAAACGDDSDPGAGGDSGSGDTKIASSTGNFTAFGDPYADGGANPIPTTIQGSAEAYSTGGNKMRVKLTVSGLPANRPFGSHLHKLACDDNKAGPHYQHEQAPDGGATDPKYANNKNEVWLDFTTNAMGEGSAEATVDWIPRAGEAKAIIIHDTLTMTGGTAGARLACINIPF
jgi:Cu-Zn family superoxide dismutase